MFGLLSTGGVRQMAEHRSKARSLDTAVRERLVSAAMDLFSRKGYAATTTREIVGAAGVTKPVLYYHFRNKEGIYLELMQKATTEFEEILNASRTDSGSPKRRILRLCDQVLALFMRRIEAARLMYSIYYGPPQGAPFIDFDALHLQFQNTIMDLVQKGIRAGELRKKIGDSTWAILGATHIAMELELSHPERKLGREGLDRVLKLILDGISAHRTGRKGGQSC
jgi:TetR/AcrR family transcriptional regulator